MDDAKITSLSLADFLKIVYDHRSTGVKSNGDEGGFLMPEYTDIPINKWNSFKLAHLPYWLRRLFPNIIKLKSVETIQLLKKTAEKLQKES